MKRISCVVIIVLLLTGLNFFQGFAFAESEKVKVYEFFSPNCGYCTRAASDYAAIESKYGSSVEIIKVDVTQNPYLASQYGVRTLPTTVVGNQKIVGYSSDLASRIESAIISASPAVKASPASESSSATSDKSSSTSDKSSINQISKNLSEKSIANNKKTSTDKGVVTINASGKSSSASTSGDCKNGDCNKTSSASTSNNCKNNTCNDNSSCSSASNNCQNGSCGKSSCQSCSGKCASSACNSASNCSSNCTSAGTCQSSCSSLANNISCQVGGFFSKILGFFQKIVEVVRCAFSNLTNCCSSGCSSSCSSSCR